MHTAAKNSRDKSVPSSLQDMLHQTKTASRCLGNEGRWRPDPRRRGAESRKRGGHRRRHKGLLCVSVRRRGQTVGSHEAVAPKEGKENIKIKLLRLNMEIEISRAVWILCIRVKLILIQTL